jgi:integrase
MAFVVLHNDKWSVDFTDDQGKRHRRVSGDGSSKKDAEKEAKLIDEQLEATKERRRVPNLADVEDVIQRWLDAAVAPLSPGTLERYQVYKRYWVENFTHQQGVVRFYSIEASHVEVYRNRRLSTAAPKTVWNEMTALRTCFAWAVARGFHKQNVAKLVPKLGQGRKIPEQVPCHYTEVQQAAILQAAWGDPQRYLMVCLGLFAGCRTGGVAGLKVVDVNLDGDHPTIRVVEKGSKERTLAIHPQLLEAFRRCPPKTGSQHWFGEFNRREACELSKELCSFIRRATGLAGMRARFHNLRHTFAITLLRQGTPLPVVSRLLGHADVTTTMNYLRVEDADKAKGIAALPTVAFARAAEPIAAGTAAAAPR